MVLARFISRIDRVTEGEFVPLFDLNLELNGINLIKENDRLGHIDHNVTRIIGFSVAVGLTVFGGVLGFHVIMKL